MQVVPKQHAPYPHGVFGGGFCGQGLGLHVPEATWVQPVGQVPMFVTGWQLPVAGSQHTPGVGQGLSGEHVVPAGSTVPPLSTQKLGSRIRHRPQQQHTSVAGLHTGLGLHGVVARKNPPRVLHTFCVVEAHPLIVQQAP